MTALTSQALAQKAEGHSRCLITLQPHEGAVKLTVVHSLERPNSPFIAAVSTGWPAILSNLKSLLETGEVAFSEPPMGDHGG